MPISSAATLLGLVFDIAGAIFVVKSLLWVSDETPRWAADATSVWAGPDPTPRPALMAMFRDSRRDARVGVGLLIAGFLGQMLGVVLSLVR